MNKRHLLLYLLVIGVFSGCMRNEEPENQRIRNEQVSAITQYLNANGLEAEETQSGIFYRAVQNNEDGRPIEEDDIAELFYHIKKLDGTTIARLDSSESDPVMVQYGNDALVPVGLDMGLSIMKQGETYEFYLPSDYAYATFSSGTLGSQEVVIVEAYVHNVMTVEEYAEVERGIIEDYIEENELERVAFTDSGLAFQLLEEKEEGEFPFRGQNVQVAYKGAFLDGEVFDESAEDEPFRFAINEGVVIRGWDEGISKMKPGEKARLIIPSNLAYGANVTVLPPEFLEEMVEANFLSPRAQSMRPFAILVFDVERVM